MDLTNQLLTFRFLLRKVLQTKIEVSQFPFSGSFRSRLLHRYKLLIATQIGVNTGKSASKALLMSLSKCFFSL